MKRLTLAAAAALLALPTLARAEPADYVHTPVVEQGERELELKTGRSRLRGGGSAAGLSLGIELGLTERYAAELVAFWTREPGEGTRFGGFELENRWQLTETGRGPFEAALLLEIERPRDRDEGLELTFGPLLQTQRAGWQANFNLLWQRTVRAAEPSRTGLVYRWQLRRGDDDDALAWGAQGFGDLGPWDDWAPRSSQSHQLGPAVFGTLKLDDDDDGVEFIGALLFGTGGAAPRHTLRLQASFPF